MLLWIAKSTMQHFYCSIFLLHKGDYMQHWIAIFLHFICSYILVQFFGIVIISRSLKWTQEIKRDSTLSQRVDRKISWAKYWVATKHFVRSFTCYCSEHFSKMALCTKFFKHSVTWLQNHFLCNQNNLTLITTWTLQHFSMCSISFLSKSPRTMCQKTFPPQWKICCLTLLTHSVGPNWSV